VNVEDIYAAAIRSWDHKRLIVDDEADVTEKALVEDAVDGVAVIDSALVLAHNAGTRGWHGVAAHVENSRAGAKSGKKNSLAGEKRRRVPYVKKFSAGEVVRYFENSNRR
jgi:hypothetical protein